MSVRQSLGKVAVVPKGSWDGTNTYEFLDIVKYDGGSYIARKDVPIGTAITNTEYWVSLVDKGEIGDDGVSPAVAVTDIAGGHRVTITDATHPQGQSIDVMDGEVNNIDPTLTIAGAAADAKATGDKFSDLKSALEQAIDNFAVPTQEAVDNWLTVHPEATTTVQDGSLTEQKFSDALKLKTVNDYVTPEMFGAVGDGVTDDTTAVQSAIDYATANKYICKLGIKTYVVTKPIVIHTHTVLVGDSQFTSIIKLANDSNCDVLQTENFADLIANGGSSTKNQPFEILLSKFSVEGNRANQTTGNGISICASRVYIDSVDVRNVKDHGLWDSFIYSKIVFTEGGTTSQANWIENVRVFCCGKHGIYQYKGNDFYYNNVIVADASMDDDKSYDLLNLSGSGRLINVHPWSSSANIIPSICRYAINFNDGDYECSECHFEGGGIASVYVAVNAHVTITSTRLYASRGNYIAEIASPLNQFIGCTFAYFPGNVKAIKYANTATRNVFDCNMQLSQSDQMYFADDSESTGLNCYRIVYFGSVLASSQPAVRNLLATSSLSYVPGNMTNFQPMNIMRDLKISRLYKDLFIFDNPTDSQQIQLNDTVVVKSNSNSKSIICDFRYYKRGAEFSFYNMMSSSITVWGAYYDSDGTQQTSFTIPAKTVFKVLIVEEGDANTSPTMLTSSQVLS